MAPEGPIVSFRRAGASFSRTELRDFAGRLLAEVAEGRRFECLVTDDRELRRLNQRFLGHDYATDVLSFPSGSDSGFAGEIAISTGRAAQQAAEFGHSIDDEVRILMLHGVLHLLGLDHEKDRGAMGRAEKRWREHFGLRATLIERVNT